MKRRDSREAALAALFSASFLDEPVTELPGPDALPDESTQLDDFAQGLVGLFEAHRDDIDREIEHNLKDWRIQRLPRVSLAILRLAIAEMLYGEAGMHSIAINEAVELAKKYGGDDDYQFINGVLGSVAREAVASGDTGTSAPQDMAQTGEAR